jgi:SAM-dependent methyltransferase
VSRSDCDRSDYLTRRPWPDAIHPGGSTARAILAHYLWEKLMGWYSRVIFPRLCDLALGTPEVEQHRRDLLANSTGAVLEIGFGTGLNLRHYPPHIRKLTVVDPNSGMHRLAQKRIEKVGFQVDQRVLRSEEIPFDDNAFDCVVSTFTLCSVLDCAKAMREIYRVLKPGGQFLFLEHGLSPEANVQKWQRRLNSFQMFIADGCHLDRNIREIVAGQPFASVDSNELYLEKGPKTHGYLYRGIGMK